MKHLDEIRMSVFFTLALSSAVPPVGTILAGVGAAKLDAHIAAATAAGWGKPSERTPPVPQSAAIRPVALGSASIEAGPLHGVALHGLTLGQRIEFGVNIGRLLGISDWKSRPPAMMVAHVLNEENQERRVLYVVQTRGDGRADIVFLHRDDNEGTFYLTSPSGVLESVVYANKKQNVLKNLELAYEVMSRFEQEKAYWLAKELETGRQ